MRIQQQGFAETVLVLFIALVGSISMRWHQSVFFQMPIGQRKVNRYLGRLRRRVPQEGTSMPFPHAFSTQFIGRRDGTGFALGQAVTVGQAVVLFRILLGYRADTPPPPTTLLRFDRVVELVEQILGEHLVKVVFTITRLDGTEIAVPGFDVTTAGIVRNCWQQVFGEPDPSDDELITEHKLKTFLDGVVSSSILREEALDHLDEAIERADTLDPTALIDSDADEVAGMPYRWWEATPAFEKLEATATDNEDFLSELWSDPADTCANAGADCRRPSDMN